MSTRAHPRGEAMLGAKTKPSFLCATLVATIFATACEDGTSVESPLHTGPATLRVLLTDAPADYIAAAEVDIGAVELIPADDGPPILLSDDGTDGFVNLLDFTGSATAQIAEAEIDAGFYTQLRLIVEAARVVLEPGYEFRDGTTEKDLKVPSGAQTGIKLNLHAAEDTDGDGPLEIIPGEMVLVLDFDVNESFVLNGNFETPAGVHGVIFKPTLRVTAEDVAASISGTVSTALTGVSVESLVVRAEPTDAGSVEGYQSQTGTALTASDGTYTIFFLVPGSYEVTVDLDPGLGTDPASHAVVIGDSENLMGVDFEVIDVTGSISGTVSTSVTGVSVEGLTVTATPSDAALSVLEATTDADGAYTFDDVVPGMYTLTVAVGTDLLTDPASQDVDVGDGEDVVDVDFEVIEDVTGSISGTVSTAVTGVSVEGLTVTATPATAGVDAVTTTTDADGVYMFDSLDPDDYSVTVEVGTGLTTDPASVDVELEEDEVETGVDFEVITTS